MKTIDFEVTLENSVDDIKKLYQIIRPNVKYEDIKYYQFKEGVINLIVHLDDNKYNEPLVIRTYSLKVKSQSKNDKEKFDLSIFQNRKLELAALKKASDLGITVNLIATYKNGFIYKYLDGEVNNVKLYNLEIAKKTAQKMARLHKINLNGLVNDKPVVFKFLEDDSILELYRSFDEKMSDNKYEKLRDNGLPLYSAIQNEYERLHNLVIEMDAYGQICFCHNDLNMTNMLIDKFEEPIFIDFELSDKNYQHYDISYHLLNMGGLFIQYFRPEDVPDTDFIKKWLLAYYEESNLLDGIQITTDKLNNLVDNELKKVLVNMLLIRLQLITRALFFEFEFAKETDERLLDYCISLYNDYLDKKDNHLKLLKELNLK